MKREMLLLVGIFLIALGSIIGSFNYAAARRAPAYENKYDYKILRVIDGDTVEISAPFLPVELKPVLKLRIFGIDTPEKGKLAKCVAESAKSQQAMKYVIDLIASAREVKVVLVKWDKYGGRVLGDVVVDGELLSKKLIDKGFAREYYGDKKQTWCVK